MLPIIPPTAENSPVAAKLIPLTVTFLIVQAPELAPIKAPVPVVAEETLLVSLTPAMVRFFTPAVPLKALMKPFTPALEILRFFTVRTSSAIEPAVSPGTIFIQSIPVVRLIPSQVSLSLRSTVLNRRIASVVPIVANCDAVKIA